MSNLSEEEIIKRVKHICDNWYDENLEIDVKWLQGLLDLYNKGKERNKELEDEDVKIRAKFILSLKDYIHKDKIRNKIKELKEDKVNNIYEKTWNKIEVLEDLLKEN